MNCNCRTLTELNGNRALDIMHHHLRLIDKVIVNHAVKEVRYQCPETALVWIAEWPNDLQHGSGPVRLRRADIG